MVSEVSMSKKKENAHNILILFLIYQGDLFLWVKLLLPGVVKRIYNMQNKQLIKIFSRYNNNNDNLINS